MSEIWESSPNRRCFSVCWAPNRGEHENIFELPPPWLVWIYNLQEVSKVQGPSPSYLCPRFQLDVIGRQNPPNAVNIYYIYNIPSHVCHVLPPITSGFLENE